MCKHTSGSMNKPSASSTEQPALHNSSVITCPSRSNATELSIGAVPAVLNHSIQGHSEGASALICDAQAKASGLMLTPAALQSNDAASGKCSVWPGYAQFPEAKVAACGTSAKAASYGTGGYDSSDEDDDVTELSPMLLSPTFAICYSRKNFQHVKHIKKYEKALDLYCNVCDDPRDSKYCSNMTNDYSSSSRFANYQPEGSPSSNGRIGRTDCETACSNHSPSACARSLNSSDSYSQVTEEVPSPEGSSNSCLTTYSSSTMNTDPVPGPSGVLPRRNSVHWALGNVDSDKEEEFRGRSYSLTPTVNFAVFESESASEAEENDNEVFLPNSNEVKSATDEQNVKGIVDDQIPVSSFHKIFHISPSAAQLSIASSYGDSGASICKICHMTAKENDPLISPCRCSGTMQYIHCGCLMRWLEISSKRSRKPASCELCQYQYHWHKKFKVRHWQFPHCSRRDKILHFLFFVSMFVMVACATITILCFKQDKGTKVNPDRTELTQSEIVTLVCGVTFFLAFFVAMYVEVKSRSTIYKLLVKFIYLNQQWYIDEYEKKEAAPVPV